MRANVFVWLDCPGASSSKLGLRLGERTGARPKIGRFTGNVLRERPLQDQLPPIEYGFVEVSPSRVLRDGEGMFLFRLSHYRASEKVARQV
jgi:hypothetical protein